MEKRPGIFSELKNFELIPPRELFNRICHALDIDQQATEDTSLPSLGQLKDWSVSPPDYLAESIKKQIQGIAPIPKPAPQKKKDPVKRLPKYTRLAIAASFLIALSCYFLYRPAGTHSPLANNNKRETAGPASSAPLADSSLGSNSADSAQIVTATTDPPKEPHPAYHTPSHIRVSGSQFPILDNDLLYTFISFAYNAIPEFLSPDDNAPLKIQVDQYANIQVSAEMKTLMKKTYQYKSGDKLTRKARKTREKIQQWKLADQKHFDSMPGNNPLDPVDLARFLLK